MGTAAERAGVRAAGREARRAVRDATRTSAEAAMIGHLRSLAALQQAASVGVFVADDGEPDLFPFVEELWARGQAVALPVVHNDPADYSMEFVPWLAGDTLTAGRYGIPVPPRTRAIEPGVIEPHVIEPRVIEPQVLLVPLTGFDGRGNRIGRGAGYFDRYLDQYSGLAVGVGFEVQRVDLVPTQDHDVSLAVLVTDLGVRFL